MRQQRGRRKPWRQSGGLGGCMLWHGNPSLLVMLACVGLWAAARLQSPAWLPPTWRWIARNEPVTDSTACKQTKYRGKDEVWSRGCCCLHALSPSLAPQPPTFSSCVSEKSNTTPFLTDVLNSWTFWKPCAVLFVCHVNCWGEPKPGAQKSRAH